MGYNIAVGAADNAYRRWNRFNWLSTTAGAFQATDPDARHNDAFVTRLNATGTALVRRSTYLGRQRL